MDKSINKILNCKSKNPGNSKTDAFSFTFTSLADTYPNRQTVLHFYHLHVPLGVEPMTLVLLAACSTNSYCYAGLCSSVGITHCIEQRRGTD